MSQWLLIDGNYLGHRAHHSTGHLSFGSLSTGVLFGFLSEVTRLCERFATTNVAFCWDVGYGHRKKHVATYKASRGPKDDWTQEEKDEYFKFQADILAIRTQHLPDLGFSNVFYEDGYEADDVIARMCYTKPRGVTCTIVSSDGDLYQLLGPGVQIWNPSSKKLHTEVSFTEEWGIAPSQWSTVKALAGCGTDEVEGLRGIGEITAAKWLRGELKAESVAFKKIEEGLSILERNLPLVKLPWPGLPVFTPKPDTVSTEKWNSFASRFGLSSLVDSPPIPGLPQGMPKGVKFKGIVH